MPIVDLIRHDKSVRILEQKINKGVYALDCADLIRQITNMHNVKQIRNLKTTQIIANFQTKFVGAVLEYQSFRSSIIGIKMQVYRTDARLELHIKSLKKHITATYGERLRKIGSTMKDREDIVDSVLDSALTLRHNFKIVMEIADAFVKDIDQNAFAMKEIKEAIALQIPNRSVQL